MSEVEKTDSELVELYNGCFSFLSLDDELSVADIVNSGMFTEKEAERVITLRKRSPMKDHVITLARNVFDGLDAGVDIERELQALYKEIEDFGLTGCDGFAINVPNSLNFVCCNSELADWLEIEESQIEDGSRLTYTREVLKSKLDNPIDDTEAIHCEEIILSENERLYVCGLGRIDGHSPVVNWIGAYKEKASFYEQLLANEYVCSEAAVDSLSKEYLLDTWKKLAP